MPYFRSAVAPGWKTPAGGSGFTEGAKRIGREIGTRAGDLGSTLRVNRVLKEVLEPAKQLARPSRAAWALAPLGLASGYLLDKYIKGEY
jgi:hypothetical protein